MRAFSYLAVCGAAIATISLSACANRDAQRTSVGEQRDAVAYTLGATGCTPSSRELPAGPHTFVVVNSGSSEAGEFELMQNGRIVGEAENLTPGVSGSFSLDLKPGSYSIHCSTGDASHDAGLRVVGSSRSHVSARSKAATEGYTRYLQTQADELVRRSDAFVVALQRGDRERAKALYIASRVPYERIEPIAEAVPEIDRALDARANDVAPAQWTGYHRIEKILWSNEPLSHAQPYIPSIQKHVRALRATVGTLQLEPARIANGAVSLLDEVTKRKITGEEERYSHTDLSDFRANIDGANAAFLAVAPLLATQDVQLARTLRQRFAAVDAILARYRRGNAYVSYTELRPADVRALTVAVDALAEPLSQVAERLVHTER